MYADISTKNRGEKGERGNKTMNDSYALTETTYYILLSLCEPGHGYKIMQTAEKLSGGRVRLAAGTLYGALSLMCEKGWIVQLPTENGSRRKEYKLTEQGKKVLLGEYERLKQMVENGRAVLGEE